MSGVFPLVGTVTFSPFIKSDFAFQNRGLPFVLNVDRGIGVSSYFNSQHLLHVYWCHWRLTLLINSNRLKMAPMFLVSLLPSADFSYFAFLAAIVTPLDMDWWNPHGSDALKTLSCRSPICFKLWTFVWLLSVTFPVAMFTIPSENSSPVSVRGLMQPDSFFLIFIMSSRSDFILPLYSYLCFPSLLLVLVISFRSLVNGHGGYFVKL